MGAWDSKKERAKESRDDDLPGELAVLFATTGPAASTDKSRMPINIGT